MSQNLLQQAAEYYKAGHRAAAEKTIKEYIQQQPDDYRGWWGLASITDKDETRRKSLQKVLQLNPEHAKARQQLGAMGGNIPAAPPASQQAEQVVPPMTAMPTSGARSQKKQTPGTTRIFRLVLFFLIVAIAGAGVIYFVMSGGEPEVSRAVMAYDAEGENTSEVFDTDDRIHIYIELDNAGSGVEVATKWFYLTGDGSRHLFHEASRPDTSSWVYFFLRRDNWSTGRYEVEVYLDDELKETVSYRIE